MDFSKNKKPSIFFSYSTFSFHRQSRAGVFGWHIDLGPVDEHNENDQISQYSYNFAY